MTTGKSNKGGETRGQERAAEVKPEGAGTPPATAGGGPCGHFDLEAHIAGLTWDQGETPEEQQRTTAKLRELHAAMCPPEPIEGGEEAEGDVSVA